MEKCGFKENGACFEINTPKTPMPWFNILMNDEYIFKCSQRLCGESFSVSEYKQKPVLEKEKQFFITVGEKKYRLCCGEGKRFSCNHYMHKTVVNEEFDEFSVQITVFVPTVGKRELWQIKLDYKGTENVDVYAAFPFADIDYQGLECHYNGKAFIKNCYPYYITYDEHETAVSKLQYTYASSSITPTSYECNLSRFFGGDNPYSLPAMVETGVGSNTNSDFEKCVAAFHHHFENKSNIVVEYLIADVESKNVKIQFPSFEDELIKVEKKWNDVANTFTIKNGSNQLQYMVNFWLKKQVIYLTTHNRGGVYCPVRNQLQDALGYAMIDAKDAFSYAMNVLMRQEESGYLKQWYMTDGSPDTGLCRINHSDAPIWLVICMTEIIRQTGDYSLFDMEVKYFNSEKKDTIKNHLKKAVEYMNTQCGSHGLCLMKDGDWTDPINGAGRFGRGESVWNTLALIYATKELNKVCNDKRLTEISEKFTDIVNKYAWDKDRYIVGYDDDGVAFGKNGDDEGALFINTQTWAIMSGVCDEEKTRILVNTIDKLKTKYGYRLLTPAFSSYNETWGKISIKQKGATENGSVYSHATMFKAYADCLRGDLTSALNTSEDLLPHMDDTIQAPLYLPNFYFGIDGDNFGRSSCVYASGAPAWMLWIMKTYFTE